LWNIWKVSTKGVLNDKHYFWEDLRSLAGKREIRRNRGKACFTPKQGCQMVYFQTKNPTLSKFWKALEWKRLVFSMPNISQLVNLWPFGNLAANLVHFTPFGILCQEKYGNPAPKQCDQI
jgi:hypothetical protein